MKIDNYGIKAILCAVIAAASGTAFGLSNQTFVSATGNDTNPCTLAMPCLTINHATPSGQIQAVRSLWPLREAMPPPR